MLCVTGLFKTHIIFCIIRCGMELGNVVGRGTFGEVHEGRLAGREVAIKVVDIGAKGKELQMMRRLAEHQHPNVVALLAYDERDHAGRRVRLLAMDLFPQSLEDVILQWAESPEGGTWREVRTLGQQIGRGLEHVHSHGVCHRDVKPSNLLVNLETSTLQICDFGTAKILDEDTQHTTDVGTPAYRAPECLVRNKRYTHSVDIWAMGCVLAEMVALRPIFTTRQNSDVARLVRMFCVRGIPSTDDLKALNPEFSCNQLAQLVAPKLYPMSWEGLLARSLPVSLEPLLDGLLCWNPTARMSAAQAQDHDFFRVP